MLLGFQKQFVPLILSGEKKQTIRAIRKRSFKIGDPLQLYTGLRTKNCMKLGDAMCASANDIEIRGSKGCSTLQPDAKYWNVYHSHILIDGRYIPWKSIFSQEDGFGIYKPFDKLLDFFFPNEDLYEPGKRLYRFKGQLVKWNHIEATAKALAWLEALK
jgi:hypothetical protein